MNRPPSDDAEQAFSACDCDAYIDHLTQVSVQQQVVIAVEDACNQFGIVMLRQGTPLGGLAAEKMRNQRLNKPVDEVLQLRRRPSMEGLLTHLNEMLEAEEDLAAIHAKFGFAGHLQHLCMTSKLPTTVLQKLTVMEQALPRVFHRSLFAAWLSALIATERKLDTEEVSLAFHGGLLHDLGLLHIAPQLVDKKQDISADEWASIQAHVEIGGRLAEELVGEAPRLATVIRQHHERCDGAGYPEARVEGQIDTVACMIALCDMLHALRFPSLLISNRSMLDSMPYLRVNRHTFDDNNYAATGRILLAAREAKKTGATRTARNVPIAALLKANRSLIDMLKVFEEKQTELQRLESDRQGTSVAILIQHIQWVAKSSGIGNESLEHWLEEGLESGDAVQGLEDIFATAQELFWLVRRIERQLLELLPRLARTPAEAITRELSVFVSAELQKAWRVFSAPSPIASAASD